ncbi:hypothetical protein AVEN_113646-1 [Araneus ventricosus]|uniref:Uncharacterized protein n=1 Tax=Araneus ventricosus TaxID=182803 RepID=A0A4Y2GGD4_ARAVE|nr:hypothetical protein AVEN_113646-1 [Araneus ventricosus]
MEGSGKTESFKIAGNSLMCFWVKRMSDGSRVPWKQAALEFFNHPRYSRTGPTFIAFLPSLRPEERKDFFYSLNYVTTADLRLCMYVMTKKEGEEIPLNDE